MIALLWALILTLATTGFAQLKNSKAKGISVGEPPPDHSPKAELASFKVLDGFEVNLFASEEDGVPNPLVLRWDERGRLWVLVTTAYPQPAPGEPCDDKVLILEDTDQDGRMDKKTTFIDGLRMPMGMELGNTIFVQAAGKDQTDLTERSRVSATGTERSRGSATARIGHELYVGEGEKLWLFKDTDGDDRVDEREVVFSGFGTGDAHQNINSFVWAPDGCLVMHQGLHCYSRVATAHGVKQLYGAGFWHFWPRSRRLEAYPTGMPQNAWGTVHDKWGQPIMVAGAAGMFWARPMEVSVPEIPDSKEQLPHFLLTRFMLPSSGQIIKTDGLRKFCGVDIVGNSHFPNEMQDEVIAGGFFENAIYRYKIIDDKINPSGYEAIEQPPLITSDNVAFRPVDVRFGPEGALYIADWYDPIIGHYQASFRHPNRDSARGRIWRVVAKGRASAKWEVLSAQSSVVDLFNHHSMSSDRWRQYQAQRLIASKPKDKVVTEEIYKAAMLSQISATKQDAADVPGMRCLQINEKFEQPDPELDAFLDSKNADLRAYATHALGNWAHLPSALERLKILITDESPRVRLEAIVACAKVKSPDAIRVALRALDKPMDTFLDRALWLAVHATKPQWMAGVRASSPHPDDGRMPSLRAPMPSLLESLPPKHLAYLIEKDGSEAVLGAAREMLRTNEQLSPEIKRSLIGALVRKGPASDWSLALQMGRDDAVLLDDLAEAAQQRRFKAPEGAEEILRGMLAESDADIPVRNPNPGGDAVKIKYADKNVRITSAAKLAGIWNLPLTKELDAILAQPNAFAEVRAEVVRALGRLGKDVGSLEVIALDAKEKLPVRLAALDAITPRDAARAGGIGARGLSDIKDAETMRAWLAPLLPRDAATKALVAALKTKPCSAETARLALQTLATAGRSDAELTTTLNALVGAKNTLPAFDPEWVKALAAEVKQSGDAEKGRAVFTSPLTSCVACHRIAQVGGTIGPELDQVGRGVPIELLIEAVVWPNRQIKEGYIATTLSTRDGRKLQGYKISDANGEFQLRDLLGSTVHRLPAGEITEKQEAGSLMPEGLITLMTREQLRDLIAFLAGLGR